MCIYKKILWLIPLMILSLNAAEKTVEIDIEGMTCPLCTTTIKKNLKKQNGVLRAKVRLNTHIATVTYEESKIATKGLLQAIEEVGYRGEIHPQDTIQKEKR